MAELPEDNSTPTPSGHELAENFLSLYANNTHFELSSWDLKILFGQLTQFPADTPYVEWRAEVTLPWLQAKLLSYFLQINIAAFESQNGKLQLPKNLFPPVPVPPSGELEKDPSALAMHEFATRLYRELTGEK
jgi:Protein of unknown function (DUF3467)